MVAAVAARHRLTIRSIDPDPRAMAIAAGTRHLGLPAVDGVTIADIVFVDGELTTDELHRLHGVLVDPLLQRGSWELPTSAGVETLTETSTSGLTWRTQSTCLRWSSME